MTHELARLALGRIFRMASRPAQPGDAEEYEVCRKLFLNAVDPSEFADSRPNYARDRLKGAQGD